MKILEIINLSKSFKKNMVLKNVNLEVFENETFGLIGKNASGKSTIINIICGLIKKDKGKIYFLGKEISYPDIFLKISVVRENPSFYPHLSLKENYRIFSEIYGNKENYEVIEKLKLSEFLKNKMSTTSRGTRQKLALALTLWSEKEFYILDEPFEHIDPETRILIYDRIKEIKKNGKSLLITTHRKEDIDLFNRIGVLENGEIVFTGKKEDKKVKEFFENETFEI
ncbi:MAG: ABC transporter ATP-binding protein [candidate division WOR-3 bacterium]